MLFKSEMIKGYGEGRVGFLSNAQDGGDYNPNLSLAYEDYQNNTIR